MKMKKFLAVLLAAAMVVTGSVTALAEESFDAVAYDGVEDGFGSDEAGMEDDEGFSFEGSFDEDGNFVFEGFVGEENGGDLDSEELVGDENADGSGSEDLAGSETADDTSSDDPAESENAADFVPEASVLVEDYPMPIDNGTLTVQVCNTDDYKMVNSGETVKFNISANGRTQSALLNAYSNYTITEVTTTQGNIRVDKFDYKDVYLSLAAVNQTVNATIKDTLKITVASIEYDENGKETKRTTDTSTFYLEATVTNDIVIDLKNQSGTYLTNANPLLPNNDIALSSNTSYVFTAEIRDVDDNASYTYSVTGGCNMTNPDGTVDMATIGTVTRSGKMISIPITLLSTNPEGYYMFGVTVTVKKGNASTTRDFYFVATTNPSTVSTSLATPKLSSVTANSTTSVTLTWGKVTGAAKYRVFYQNGSNWTKIADTTSNSYTWTGAKAKTKYTFTVRCISADGSTYTSKYDATGMSITMPSTSTLATPKISSVTAKSSTSVAVTWGKVTGAAKYRLFYKDGTGWTKIADTTSTSYTWTGAKAGTTYTFTVRCISSDAKSYTSNYDATGKSVTTPGSAASTNLATPKLSSVTANSSTSVTVKWGAVTGAAKYRVFYKNGSSWTKIADTTSTSYTWTGAKAGTKYTFTVRCISSDAKSYTSNYDATGKSVTTPGSAASTNLATPKLSSVTAKSSTSIALTWGKVTGAAKYRVFYKNGSSWTKIADTTSTSYTWTGAKAGTKYTFTVRCISSDAKSYTSNYDSTGKSVTTPGTATASKLATPKISSVSNTSSGVKLSWGKVSGAAKYRVFYKNGSGWTRIADTTSTSYTWIGAKPGTTYTFTVRCISADGKSYTSSYDSTGKTITYR